MKTLANPVTSRCSWFCFPVLLFLAYGTITAQSATSVPVKADEPKTFQAGGSSIAIPAPWHAMVELGPNNRKRMDQFVPPSNRLIAAFVPSEDLDRIVSGDKKTPSRITIVAVSREYELTEVNKDNFKLVVDGVAKQFDTTVDSYIKEDQQEFDQRLKSLGLDNVKITFNKPISLGSLFYKENAAGFGTILQVSANGVVSTKALSVLYVCVKNRVLYAYVFADYKDSETARWLRKASEDWADEILKANGQ